MQNRWIILSVLFFARTTMAFQFQSVAALSPLMIDSLLLSIVDIGFLIGLYLGPGVLVALLGGTIASVFGDKRVVVTSLLLMFLGSILMFQGKSFEMLIAGRILSGVGGVVVNVLMTKMVIDWFAGRGVATAMAIFLGSWPVGIGLALVTLPLLAHHGGLNGAWSCVSAMTAVSLLLFGLTYRTAEGAVAHGRLAIAGLPWVPLVLAASIWGFYNSAIAMVFGFGPIILVENGLSITEASSATSMFMFAIAVAAPLGGRIADKSGHRDAVILFTLIAGIVLLPAMPHLSASTAWILYGLAGFVIGLSPGAIVSMTSQFLPAQARAFGTGVYYMIYYAVMMIAPPVAGAVAEWTTTASTTFTFGAVMMGICVVALLAFRKSVAASS